VAVWFIGCKVEPDPENTGFILEGVWKSFYDSYTITKTTVDYLMDNSEWGGTDTILKGTIEKSIAFTDNAGTLIIKVTESIDEWNPFTINKYAGVYYKEGAKNSIKMATALKADYSPLETDTLAEAEILFTVDNANTNVGMWGSYTK
jgi:hypothetical protein